MGRAHGSRIWEILGGQALAAVGAPGCEHLAAALRLHAGTETVPALANELARLIGPLHGSSPVARGRHARGLAAPLTNCGAKTISAPGKGAPSHGAAYGGRSCQSQRSDAPRAPQDRRLSSRPEAVRGGRGTARPGAGTGVRGTSRTRLHCSTGGREASVAAADHSEQDQARSWTRYLPLAALGGAMGIVFATGAPRIFSPETIVAYRDKLQAFVDHYGPMAVITYAAVYVIAVA